MRGTRHSSSTLTWVDPSRSFWYVVRKAKVATAKGAAGATNQSAQDEEDWVHHFSLQLRVVTGTGNQAVLGAGFAFLTVIGFQDTVLGQFGSQQPYANLYLLANALAALLAIMSTQYVWRSLVVVLW